MELESSLPRAKIKPSDVYKVLESRKFVEKIYNEMLHDIKTSSSYINLKEIALQHFASIEADDTDSQDINETIERKKKLSRDVGYLSDCIASTLTKTVQKKLQSLQDDIYAASQAVIEELEKKNSDNGEMNNCKNVMPIQSGTLVSYSPTLNRRSKKRCIESKSDAADVSPSKRLSNRFKKPNSKYYSENILTSVADSCFDDAS